MKTCPHCGLDYQPVTGEDHNGIHRPRVRVIDEVRLFAVSLVSDPLPGYGIKGEVTRSHLE